MQPTKIDRLYSTLLGYQRSFEELAMTAGSLAQDLSYLVSEVKEWKDQQEVIEHGRTDYVGTTVIDDGDELPGC